MQTTVGDINVSYQLSGASGAPVVAMSHSLGSSSVMWEPQLRMLEDRFQVLRYDTRGHGGTSAPAGKYSMTQLVADASGLLDALQIEQAHWVGLSMGGMIGQGLALRAPHRLLSVCLCNTMAIVREESKAMWRQRIKTGERFGMPKLVDFAMERWFTDGYRDADGDEYQTIRAQFLATDVTGYIGCCRAIYELDYLEELNRIKVPAHIIGGDQDLATPVSESFVMHERIAHSSIKVIEGAAHLSNVEKAAEFNASLIDFLSSA